MSDVVEKKEQIQTEKVIILSPDTTSPSDVKVIGVGQVQEVETEVVHIRPTNTNDIAIGVMLVGAIFLITSLVLKAFKRK